MRYSLIILMIVFFNCLGCSQKRCNGLVKEPFIQNFYNTKDEKSDTSYIDSIIRKSNNYDRFYWLPTSHIEIFDGSHESIMEELKDLDIYLNIKMISKCRKFNETSFWNGCKGAVFNIYELYYDSEKQTKLIECAWESTVNKFIDNKNGRLEILRKGDRIYIVRQDKTSTIRKDEFGDNGLVFQRIVCAIRDLK